ncbi:hypothetical protein [Sphingomonas hankookensis]|uniref:hypothetical protein n=1 Tax=Sphingomonas hankookensis TaxID=563996 RepID=UPI003D301F36
MLTVKELIEQLQTMPADAPVKLHWDGASRQPLEAVWLAQGGHVALSDLWEQPVYDDEDRIAGAVPTAEKRYLYVHEMLGVPSSADAEYE